MSRFGFVIVLLVCLCVVVDATAHGGLPQSALASTLTLIRPNGGSMYLGFHGTITWTSSGTVGPVLIELSRSGPSGPWAVLTPSTPNDGWFTWEITGQPSGDCWIRIQDSGNASTADTTDVAFAIRDFLPPITVLAQGSVSGRIECGIQPLDVSYTGPLQVWIDAGELENQIGPDDYEYLMAYSFHMESLLPAEYTSPGGDGEAIIRLNSMNPLPFFEPFAGWWMYMSIELPGVCTDGELPFKINSFNPREDEMSLSGQFLDWAAEVNVTGNFSWHWGPVTGLVPLEPASRPLRIAPNPGRSLFALRVTCPWSAGTQDARVTVFDVHGGVVAEAVEQNLPAGVTELTWAARDRFGQPLVPGVYFLNLVVDGRSLAMEKITIVR